MFSLRTFSNPLFNALSFLSLHIFYSIPTISIEILSHFPPFSRSIPLNLANPSGFLLFSPTMSSFILFLFCLFFHGSHARSLDLHESSHGRNAPPFGEFAEKIASMRTISSKAPSKFTPRALLGSFKTEKQVEISENNLIGVNPTAQKASNSSQKDSSLSGMKEVPVSDEIDLHAKECKTKEEEEAVDLKENGGEEEEDVMMDYAQPHRKPPIHNEKP